MNIMNIMKLKDIIGKTHKHQIIKINSDRIIWHIHGKKMETLNFYKSNNIYNAFFNKCL